MHIEAPVLGKESSSAMLAFMAAGVAAQSVDYSTMLGALYQQTDVNKDGALSFLEFTDATGKLGVKPEVFTLHSKSFQVFFDAIDSDGSGTVTQTEFACVPRHHR